MPLARIPGGTYFGTVMHKVYERVDCAAPDLEAEVARVVDLVVTGSLRDGHRDPIVDGVVRSLVTPLGGPFGDMRLSGVAAGDRLHELGFDVGLAPRGSGAEVGAIGEVLLGCLDRAGRADDILAPYARTLAASDFGVPLAGLMNGSIDTLLRVAHPRGHALWVTDWKTNRLDSDGMGSLIEGYGREQMCAEMEHHHYPLQALIYGTAIHRWVRSRGAAAHVAGLAYLFVRGMVGEATPLDGAGNRHGVFVWEAPPGLWEALSGLLSGADK